MSTVRNLFQENKQMTVNVRIATIIIYLNQVLIGHFSNLLFLLSANDIKIILPNYVHINGVQFQCFFGKKIFHITDFWVRNAKVNFFEEKCVYCAAFIKLKCRRFHTGLVD